MIDLVCPIWNRKEFVALTLKSLDKYLDFRKVYRLLLLDDFSTDGASDVAREWAKKHDCAVYRQARNPTLSTGWPLFEALRILNSSKWLGIWLSDWYMCQPLIPVVEDAMALAGEDADVLSSVTMRVTDEKKYSPQDVLRGRRHPSMHGSIRGGFNLFRRRFLDRVRPVFKRWGSISGMFNGLLRAANVKYRCHWIVPPPAFLHLDEDIPGNGLTQYFYKAEGIDVPRLLDLTRRYAKEGWCRNEVVKGGIVQRARVGAVYPKDGDTRPKGWRKV
jgi:glycosyltransferase involved in cell wall biosynthesis